MTSAPKCGHTYSGQLSEILQFQELQTLNVSEDPLNVVHKVKVHIVTAGETFGADNVLLRDLVGLQVESTDQQGCSVIILFCPISSCVGSDMKAAMKKVSGDKPVILVLMHHTRNPDYSTCGESQCSVYQNVVLVVHVLFHESVKGLLPSSKNNEAVQQIHYKLLQYSSISRLRNDQGIQDMSQSSRRTVEEAHEVVHKVKVHIVTAGETFGADNVLLRDLVGLQVESTDQQGCSIIILFCPISSCVGSDMKAALKKVSAVFNSSVKTAWWVVWMIDGGMKANFSVD
ncbi:uncharacterized protein LOC120433522 [Oreochromis aureus]|uniref:uncharacterized protein LOC120433522 n=1 Tax=Oreochromis aureus TaxID=47969 RepID=UPI001952A20A|nr:uncharacterized protein LOC120433522 [Oreochromis aureus]